MIRYLLFPIMKKFRKLVISMIGVSFLGIALLVGLSGAYMSLDTSLNRYVRDYHYADIVLTTDQADVSVEELLSSVDGVYQVDCRLIADVPVRLPGGRLLSLRGVSYGIRDFQNLYVWERAETSDYPNIALEYNFADDNGIHAGDLFEIKVDGEYETVCIGSIVTGPELLGTARDSYSWGENEDFGYFFVPENYAFGTEFYGQCNQFLIRTETWADPDVVLNDIQNCLSDAGVEVKLSFAYPDSPVQARIEVNLEPIYTLSVYVPSLFFVTMVAVSWLFLSQIIRQCRREIGILRALGFEKRQIRSLFCLITLIITLIACVIGIGIGYVLLHFTTRLFGDFLSLPQIYYIFSRRHTIIAVIVTILAGQFSALLSTVQISSIMPSEAMSREAPSIRHTPRFVQRLLHKASTSFKYGITSIFRSVKRFAFSIFCVTVTLALIFTSIAFHVSKNYLLHQFYDLRTHYDAQIFVGEAPTAELLSGIASQSGVSDVETLSYLDASVSANGHTADVTFAAPADNSVLVTVTDSRDDPLPIPAQGVILERHLAQDLEVAVGDTVTVNGVLLEVAALSAQSISRQQYISQQTMSRLGTPDQYTVICHAADEDGLLRYASDLDSYLYTNFTDVLRRANTETFALLTLGVYILICFSVLLGFLIIYNTTQTNLFEQKKELSVLRSLGFHIREISRIWFVQTAVQFFLSCAIGLPLGTALAKYALQQMSVVNREYPFVPDPMQYVLTVCIVLAYILISHYLAMRNIRKWDIVENIKEKE